MQTFQARSGRWRRHRPGGHRRGAQGARCGRTGVRCEVRSTEYDLGAERYHATGEVLPDPSSPRSASTTRSCSARSGAPGDPTLPPGMLERGCCSAAVRARPLRQPASLAALPGRDLAAGRPRRRRLRRRPRGHRGPVRRQRRPLRAAPRRGGHRGQRQHRVRRRARSCATRSPAREAPRKQLTWCTRPTCSCTPGLWSRIVGRGRQGLPEVTRSTTCTSTRPRSSSTTDPARFDVIVTDNLFGDILTDLAAAVTGGIGLAASGNINPDRTAPSMFEPVHGPRRTSRPAARPTRPRPSCRWRCCSTTSASPRGAARRGGGHRRSRGARRRHGHVATSEVGDAVAARSLTLDPVRSVPCTPWTRLGHQHGRNLRPRRRGRARGDPRRPRLRPSTSPTTC